MLASARFPLALFGAPFRFAIDLALPPRCPGCGVVALADHLFCSDCWQKLDFLGSQACRTCGHPFPLDPGPDAQCAACLADPPESDGMRAAVAYGEIARSLVLRLKHGGRPGVAVTLARLMRRLIEDDASALLVPVPLHRWRLWWRGYNQSALMAQSLARQTGLTCRSDLLIRVKATPMLRGMGPNDRRKTVRGAFRVAPKYEADIKGRDIILIDDVYTTGATANACARALKRAGAANVHICCWARVVRDIDNAPQR